MGARIDSPEGALGEADGNARARKVVAYLRQHASYMTPSRLFDGPALAAGVLRYDSLDSGSMDIGLVTHGVLPPADFTTLAPATPERLSMMFDWNPSEFSRLRLQYAWDHARAYTHDQQLMLQYLYSIGAHGAHKF